MRFRKGVSHILCRKEQNSVKPYNVKGQRCISVLFVLKFIHVVGLLSQIDFLYFNIALAVILKIYGVRAAYRLNISVRKRPLLTVG